MKRATIMAALNLLFRSFRLSERQISGQTRIGMNRGPSFLAAVEIRLPSIPRGRVFWIRLPFCKFADK